MHVELRNIILSRDALTHGYLSNIIFKFKWNPHKRAAQNEDLKKYLVETDELAAMSSWHLMRKCSRDDSSTGWALREYGWTILEIELLIKYRHEQYPSILKDGQYACRAELIMIFLKHGRLPIAKYMLEHTGLLSNSNEIYGVARCIGAHGTIELLQIFVPDHFCEGAAIVKHFNAQILSGALLMGNTDIIAYMEQEKFPLPDNYNPYTYDTMMYFAKYNCVDIPIYIYRKYGHVPIGSAFLREAINCESWIVAQWLLDIGCNIDSGVREVLESRGMKLMIKIEPNL